MQVYVYVIYVVYICIQENTITLVRVVAMLTPHDSVCDSVTNRGAQSMPKHTSKCSGNHPSD